MTGDTTFISPLTARYKYKGEHGRGAKAKMLAQDRELADEMKQRSSRYGARKVPYSESFMSRVSTTAVTHMSHIKRDIDG